MVEPGVLVPGHNLRAGTVPGKLRLVNRPGFLFDRMPRHKSCCLHKTHEERGITCTTTTPKDISRELVFRSDMATMVVAREVSLFWKEGGGGAQFALTRKISHKKNRTDMFPDELSLESMCRKNTQCIIKSGPKTSYSHFELELWQP